MPSRIRVADYPQLRLAAWHVEDSTLLTAQEALDLYERNWRHIDVEKMSDRERELLDKLVKGPGKGRLLVRS
ncbi:MAG TPA: hypothetical protein PK177_11010 [Burkholderiaceae bacterium]|nr:hypothetical protein [Burkholderiaceae bacterium]